MLTTVARTIRRADTPVDPTQLREKVGVGATRLTSAVNLLEQAGAVATTEQGDLVWQEGTVGKAVEGAEEIAESRRRVDRSRVDMMRAYAETEACRRQFLLAYFGEELEEPCGHCDTCDSGSAARVEERAEEAEDDRAGDWPVGLQVLHQEWGEGSVVSDDGDRITVLFGQEGYKTLALEVVEDSDVLRRV
jgi:ATP-dependent DNA helicase RecQ